MSKKRDFSIARSFLSSLSGAILAILMILLLVQNYEWVQDISKLPTSTKGKVFKAFLHWIDLKLGKWGVFSILSFLLLTIIIVLISELKALLILIKDIKSNPNIGKSKYKIGKLEWAWFTLYKSNAPESVRRNKSYLQWVDNCIRQDEYYIKFFPRVFKSKPNIESFIENYVSQIGDKHKFKNDHLEERYQQYRKDYGQVPFWRRLFLNDRPLERASWLEENNHLLTSTP